MRVTCTSRVRLGKNSHTHSIARAQLRANYHIYVYDPLHSLCKGIYNDLILFFNFLKKKNYVCP